MYNKEQANLNKSKQKIKPAAIFPTLLECPSLPTACLAVGKGPKTGSKGFADCFPRGSRQRTRGKEFVGKEPFAACQVKSSRQSLCHMSTWQSAKGTTTTFTTSFSLPPARQSAKDVFADCLEWPTAQDIRTVGKDSFCRLLSGAVSKVYVCRLPGLWQVAKDTSSRQSRVFL